VPNPSFEDSIDCTNSSIRNSPPWCPVGKYSALHFLKCQSDPYSTTPFQYIDNCFQSYQIPRTGTAYCVLGIYNMNSASNYDVFPQVKLIDTLKLNKIYCVTFYVSLWNYCKYSFDKLGARLSSTSFPCIVAGTNTMTIAGSYTPQIVSPAGVQLDDTLNWMEVSGTYLANGTETYLTIGDFFLQAQHSIVQTYPSNCNGVADYYLDDVSVEEVEIAKAKNDTLIYAMDSVVIGANNSEAALFNWQPTAGLSCTNCPNPKASPTVNTTYTVTKTQCKVATTDVITISVSSVGINELSIHNAIILQPNPTNGIINIDSKFEMQRIEVMNVAGQMLFSETVNKKDYQLQLQDLAEGIYFVRVVYANGLGTVKKVIKQ
jgi:hypothetical protein